MYDGRDLVLVFNETGSLTNRLLPDAATDAVFADENALGEILWYLTDHQGTIRDVARRDAATGQTTVVNHLTYSSFGAITSESDPSRTPIVAYTGMYRDADTGLQKHGERWYDPATRQWLSEDPIGFAAGDANLRRYVGNSPPNFVDPTGLTGFGHPLQSVQYNFNLMWQGFAGWIEGLFGGRADLPGNTIHHLFEGGVYGGFTSAMTCRLYPLAPAEEMGELSNFGARLGAGLTGPVNSATDLITGQDVLGQPTSRPLAAMELLLMLGPEAYAQLNYRPPVNPFARPPSAPTVTVIRDFPDQCQIGTRVHRHWGGRSGPFGESWTRDPVSTHTRESLGLGRSNTGEFISHGTVIDNSRVTTRRAQPWGEFGGGGDEVLIPDPQVRVRLDAVTMPDTPLPDGRPR